MLRMCVYMHYRFVKNHPIRILEDGPLISEGFMSHHRFSLSLHHGCPYRAQDRSIVEEPRHILIHKMERMLSPPSLLIFKYEIPSSIDVNLTELRDWRSMKGPQEIGGPVSSPIVPLLIDGPDAVHVEHDNQLLRLLFKQAASPTFSNISISLKPCLTMVTMVAIGPYYHGCIGWRRRMRAMKSLSSSWTMTTIWPYTR
jgi:hypothetical protein